VVYRCEPVLQFSKFTNKAKQLKRDGALFASKDFMDKYNLNENDIVEISNENISITTKVQLDNKITGDIPYLPTFDEKLDVSGIFKNGYRYAKVNLKKV